MSEVGTDYTLHEGDAGRDRDALLTVWHGSLGTDAAMRAKYDWFYLACPHGPPLIRLLRHVPSGAWVGTCTAGARHMLLDGRPLVARLLADLAVVPTHRSLGPALAMQRALLSAAVESSGLAYGFPNPKAVAMVRHAGAGRIADMVRYVRVLRHGPYLQRRMSTPATALAGAWLDITQRVRESLRRLLDGRDIASAWSKHADARMDALWQASAPATGWTAIRDAEHLRWRFDAAPAAAMRYLCVMRGQTLCAWFAARMSGSTLQVMDFWSLESMDGMRTAWIRQLLHAARVAGAATVSVEIATGARQLRGWRGCGFVERGRRPVHGLARAGIGFGPATEYLLTAADEDE
ncbi:MAG: hypothetical protein QM769_09620 [Pseudoxanthomonas sp.]